MKPYYIDEDCPYRHTRLMFPKEWIGTKLPKEWEHSGADQTEYFKIELVDTEDNNKSI